MEEESSSLSCSQNHEEEDRISKLPDSLIHEILSSIDLRYAVQTCVLSKRWKNVWTSLPFITLTWEAYNEDKLAFLEEEEIDEFSLDESINGIKEGFERFANKVLDDLDHSDILRIKLGFFLHDYASVQTLNRWISAAVNRNVQALTLDVGYYVLGLRFEIPYELLNCQSLKSLSIMVGDGPFGKYTDVILPKSMSLPQIRTLWLDGMSISNLELQRLFSSCPLMESVIIQECIIQANNQRNIVIDSQSLESCALINNRHTHLGSADHYNTMISAPNAKGFRCTGFMTEDFYMENLSSLVGAHLYMRLRENEEEEEETAETYFELAAEEKEALAKRMMKVLGAVHNVQHMTLSSGFLEVLLQAPGTLYGQPLQLCNLQILKLEIRFTRGCLRSIAYLLKISPVLTALKLRSKESNLADIGDDWEAEFSSTDMFSHLKFVDIRGVEGCDNELKFLRFLLKNSMVLEKLNLLFRSNSGLPDKVGQVRQFVRDLRALPRASSSVQLGLYTLKMQS